MILPQVQITVVILEINNNNNFMIKKVKIQLIINSIIIKWDQIKKYFVKALILKQKISLIIIWATKRKNKIKRKSQKEHRNKIKMYWIKIVQIIIILSLSQVIILLHIFNKLIILQ